jgi:hypothetical protein
MQPTNHQWDALHSYATSYEACGSAAPAPLSFKKEKIRK